MFTVVLGCDHLIFMGRAERFSGPIFSRKNIQDRVNSTHGVQRRMISVDNFFVFLRLLFFAVLLLYETECTLWRLYFTIFMC